jgi:hypothetical protein
MEIITLEISCSQFTNMQLFNSSKGNESAENICSHDHIFAHGVSHSLSSRAQTALPRASEEREFTYIPNKNKRLRVLLTKSNLPTFGWHSSRFYLHARDCHES